jgi:hypothetical protein
VAPFFAVFFALLGGFVIVGSAARLRSLFTPSPLSSYVASAFLSTPFCCLAQLCNSRHGVGLKVGS